MRIWSSAPALKAATDEVWQERDSGEPPTAIPPLPNSWPDRYERLATDHDLDTASFPDAVARVNQLWAQTRHG